MIRYSNRPTLWAILVCIIIVGVFLDPVVVILQKSIRQQRLVADLMKFDGSTVFALYGVYKYTPPPVICSGEDYLLLSRPGHRMDGFFVIDEPSRIESLFVPLFGEHAFTEISEVYWEGAPITDADLQLLTELPQIRELDISGTKVTDMGVKHILRLKYLTVLDLSYTHITIDGVRQLSTCSNLRVLDLSGIQINNTIAHQLKQSLPSCLITW